MRALSLVVALALVALGVTACGEKEERVGGPARAEPFELLLDYFPNADHAGIYAAQAAGHFRQVGLDVTIRQPADPAAPIKQVAAGKVDLAVSYEPEVLRARDQGLRVVAVGALVQEPLTSIVSLPRADVRRPADLAGKVVGTSGIDYQGAYLRTIADEAGLARREVRERNVGFNLVPALLTGRVDAVLGAFWNYEGIQLRLEGRRPRIIRMEDAGVPTYDELVLVANEEAVRSDASRLRRFIGALGRGTRELRRDPERGIEGLLEANPDLEPRLQRAVVRVTLPLFLPPSGRPYGWQDPAEWRAFAAWMHENRLIRDPGAGEGAFTNELLPGEGL